MSGALRIVEPGLLTQLQGSPYRGQRGAGMPLAGAADPLSLALANWLAGNRAEAAAIETAFAPLSFEALAPLTLGIAGVSVGGDVSLNGASVPPYRTLHMAPGDTLRIAAPRGGCRTYVALGGGGFECAEMMGARSTYLPGGFGGIGLISAGTTLGGIGQAQGERELPEELRLPLGDAYLLRVVAAPESTPAMIGTLTRAEGWRIGRRADRIGIELEGPSLPASEANMVSSAVFPGTIQAPPGGRPYLLGPDAATMGGYPRAGQIIRADRHLIGQLRPGARLRLVAVEPDEAREIYRGKMQLLRRFLPDIVLD